MSVPDMEQSAASSSPRSLRETIEKREVSRTFWSRFFPSIEHLEDARDCTRRAAIAGLVFAGMYVLAIALLIVSRSRITSEELITNLLGTTIILSPVLFFTWRVYRNGGYISATLLLLLFLFEIASRVAYGGFVGPVWIFIYLYMVIAFVNGIRGGLALKRVPQNTPSEVAATFS
jgi:hypothetical protein